MSQDGRFDYTAIARLDVGIPTRTAVSGDDVQLTPYFGQLLRVGEHISLAAWTGSQFSLASHQTNQFLYGASCGYRITRGQMALPRTSSVTPLFEVEGQIPFSHGERNAMFGVAGFNWQLAALGELHARINLGYQFPLDRGARDQLHWGIISVVSVDY